jgi:hypothetical protein
MIGHRQYFYRACTRSIVNDAADCQAMSCCFHALPQVAVDARKAMMSLKFVSYYKVIKNQKISAEQEFEGGIAEIFHKKIPA